jgi:hypothetical protein
LSVEDEAHNIFSNRSRIKKEFKRPSLQRGAFLLNSDSKSFAAVCDQYSGNW